VTKHSRKKKKALFYRKNSYGRIERKRSRREYEEKRRETRETGKEVSYI
jgi:hypothetical protein